MISQQQIDIIIDKIDVAQNTCTIAIIDNGIGLTKETLLKVFEINSIVSTFGTNKEKGTGLGLKLCKEFLTINKGNIKIESHLEKGTKVYLTLPIEFS